MNAIPVEIKFGPLIDAIIEAGLTLTKIEYLTGIKVQTINNYRKGSTPPYDNGAKLINLAIEAEAIESAE